MQTLFWCAAVFVGYTYVLYPTIMWVWSLLAPRWWIRQEIYPVVSILMAVHNGAVLLRDKITELVGLEYPTNQIEIIVVSDGSTDETVAILNTINHPRLRWFCLPDHRGKAAALNVAMANARGEFLVFVDLRPRLRRDALRLLMRNFADPAVGCVAGRYCPLASGAAGVRAVGGLYWRYEQWIRDRETLVDSTVGVPGAFYAVRRGLAVRFPDGLILDDMYQPLHVVGRGFRSVLDNSAQVIDFLPRHSRCEFSRKVRTLAGNFQLFCLAPWLLTRQNRLRFQLVSHKVFRLGAPIALLVAFVSSFCLRGDGLLYGFLWWFQAAFYLLASLGLLTNIPVLSQISSVAAAFCMLNAAAIVAMGKFSLVRGPLLKIWAASEERFDSGVTTNTAVITSQRPKL